MLAAKNNRSHLDIKCPTRIPGAPGCYKGDRRERRVLAAKGINWSRPDFIMAGQAGISNMKSQRKEIKYLN
jgi:hypothetical protein